MKILLVIDSKIWAIGYLAKLIKEKNSHHNIEILEIHPKDYRKETEKFNKIFEDKLKEFQPDVIHFHYWDTAKYLSELPCTEGIKKILSHHNQKNLLSHKWAGIDVLVVACQKSKEILEKAGYWNVEAIPYGVDVAKFKYLEEYNNDNRLLGYVGRIVPWKGLVDILKVAKVVDSEVVMMGRIDKADYWQECLKHELQMDIRFETPTDQQPSVFHEMSCYIGNSIDGIEEGTLGLLEAMSCGIPVITTPSGLARDIIKHGENGILVDFEDYESLEKGVKMFLGMTLEEKNTMRQKAWDTVRLMTQDVMARNYEKLYYKTFYKKDLVSVIIPTCERADTIIKVLDGYAKQTYSPIELVVVVDDIPNQQEDEYENILRNWKQENAIPIKWMYTNNQGYGLAQARNIGIFEAGGNYLIFNDDRYVPEIRTVEYFVNNIKKIKVPSAVWGNKTAGKRDFIENFMIIRKNHIADAGMFNERIDEWGGQSQEIRERLRNLGFSLQYEPMAIAKPQFGTHSRTKHRYSMLKMKNKLWMLRN